MNENKPADDAHAQRRRRVLRGALSAPVVLTISNGAGAQMASNLRCVANQVTTPVGGIRSVPVSTSLTSSYLRVKLYRATPTAGLWYVSGTDIQNASQIGRTVTWISIGQWWQFNPTTNLRVGASPVTGISPTLTSPERWAVLQVDQNGDIVSVGNHSASTSMVYQSCWNSFRG